MKDLLLSLLPLLLLLLLHHPHAINAWIIPPSSKSTTPLTQRRRRHSTTSLRSSSFAEKNTISFHKYEGLGNDFILIDDRDKTTPSLTPEQSRRLCHRNFGVGADGVIFALAPFVDEEKYDFSMRIYNSDGSEPEMCGNGIRCLAQFLKDLGEDATSYKISTLAGPIIPILNPNDDTITVDMGEPIFEASLIPCTLPPNTNDNAIVEQTLTDQNSKQWSVTTVSMGNPHCILFVNDLDEDIDFDIDGPALESHESFPSKTNVEFVQVVSDTHLKMKVWERGAGPTLACGTGACALVVAAMRAGKIPRGEEQVRVTLPGGDLLIEWREGDNKVYMTGPATFSFRGEAVVLKD